MTQPSGWYDDPQDPLRLRYWDGVLWTDHTVPKTSPSASDSTIGRAVDPYAAPGVSIVPGAAGGAGQPGPYGPGTQSPAPSDAPLSPYANPGQTPYGQPPTGFGYGAAPTMAWRPTGPTTPEGTPLAQWWQRLLAALLDGIILQLIGGALAFPWLRDFVVWYVDFLQESASGTGTTDLSAVLSEISTEMARFLVPITLIQAVVTLAYHVFFLSRNGASLGKLALGIRVRRTGRPGPLTVVEAARRQSVQFVLALASLIPILGTIASLASYLDNAWLIWDPRRQCVHDKIADTLVEQKPRQPR